MALEFQERTDGYRVLRANGAMIANVTTKAHTGYDLQGNAAYTPLPKVECSVHSAIGPLTVAELQEILAGIPNA